MRGYTASGRRESNRSSSRGYTWRALSSQDFPGDYLVYAVNHDGDGEIYIALFSGPQCRELAEEYARWKNLG
jgi:hypothetical protein